MQKWRKRNFRTNLLQLLSKKAFIFTSMASPPSKLTVFSFLFSLLLFTFFFPRSSSNSINFHSHSGKKISVGLYYESLCPYSANFIVNYLAKLVEDDDLISIVDLKLVPWGNAKLKSNATFVCQHGPSECLLNTIEACAISAWPQLSEHFPVIYCIEELAAKGMYLEWESCFDELGLDSKLIHHCYASGYGKELELEHATNTNNLDPPHQYVPWVVVDGTPLYEDYENFVSYICKAYKGSRVPKACSQSILSLAATDSITIDHQVSYKDKFSAGMRSAI